jgi:hypothetical protein
METNLRPLSLGEILDRTAQLYRTNFLLFAGISAIYSGVVLILSLVNLGLAELLHLDKLILHPQWLPLTFYGIYVLLMVLLVFAFGGVSVAANNRTVAWVHLGEPASIRSAYASILPRLGRYLWLMVIIAFFVWTPFILLYGGYFGAIFLYFKPRGVFNSAAASANPNGMIAFGIVTLIFFLLMALALIYAIFMGLRYSLALPACVVENLPARQAIRRSIDLSKGSRWRILVLGLLVVIVEFGLVLVTQIFFFIVAFQNHGELSLGLRALQQVISFFTNSFIGPIYATGFTLFYYDQRVRKEGYDIEWMMQAAGLAAPAPVAASLESMPALDAHADALKASLPATVPEGLADRGGAHE